MTVGTTLQCRDTTDTSGIGPAADTDDDAEILGRYYSSWLGRASNTASVQQLVMDKKEGVN